MPKTKLKKTKKLKTAARPSTGSNVSKKRTLKSSAPRKPVSKDVKDVKMETIFCTICPNWQIKRPEVCSNTLTTKTKKHYFCTKRCKERFLKNEKSQRS